MKVEVDNDEAWNLMSQIVVKLIEEAPLSEVIGTGFSWQTGLDCGFHKCAASA